MKTIHNWTARILPLMLAAALQVMPMLRNLLPLSEPGLAPSAWSIVFKLATGAVALMGYHAISSASSIAISPATALQGVPYTGTITYSGGHAGNVSCWNGKSNWTNTGTGTCQAPYPIAPGLMATPNANNTCNVSGTPTNQGSFSFTMTVHKSSGCSGNSDSRSTSIAIGSTNGANFAPTWALTPQAQVAQVGSDTILSSGALGKPTPDYYWFNGFNQVGTGNSVTLTNVQLSSAGLYTVQASNSVGTISTNAYLTVVATPSSLLFDYTNYLAVGSSTNLTCTVSNVAGSRNSYQWLLNGTGIPLSNTNNIKISNVGHSPYVNGTYTISFTSYITTTNGAVVTTNYLMQGNGYDSYWQFGQSPVISGQPSSQTVNAGTPVSFSVTASGDTGLGAPGIDPFGRSLFGTNYQWFSSNSVTSVLSPLANQTNATFTISSPGAGDAGNYLCVVTNVYGAATSSVVTLTVNAGGGTAPTISSQPASQIVPQGATVLLGVTAAGSPTPAYQWKKGAGNLSDGATGNGSTFGGSATATLAITNAQAADSGSYSVGITNTAGGTNSSAAQLLVVAPAAGGQTPQLAGGTAGAFSFTALAGYRYLVQRNTNLTAGIGWVTLTNLSPAFSGYVFNYSDNPTSPAAYYRAFMTNQ
jgi:Immunoglobulin I-set domain/Immunoglobulin domain